MYNLLLLGKPVITTSPSRPDPYVLLPSVYFTFLPPSNKRFFYSLIELYLKGNL